ncbi:CheR family methyltransferase [sulfur-oxidizing endosymbiont of Gigantopelta aegis]|uniref:CheR family methyltransferase n=1 Tax=sulfur-oxidizing endosymbiont of Gigantopelta aegis TaxID=2794934 RepID=UPI0018DD5684|nr:protein-glutamate O-methyltransferase CheR [sulfur-oxidizing endosymbiont of Gigantopelta aegis]
MAVLNGSLSCFEQMDDVQFSHWTSLLEQRTGMHLPRERRSFLETSLGLRMKEIGIPDFTAYYHHLQSEKNGQQEWLTLVDRLTIHETRFFRHQPSLDFLEEIILPELFKSEPDRKKLQIWSAGCSTGEEVYTLGMLCQQFLKQHNNRAVSKPCYLAITGMDISVPALVTARKALYDQYKVRHVPEQYLEEYFVAQHNGRYQIVEALKKRVCFVPFNIIDMKKTLLEPMDIIFCQNVLIYFNRDRRKQIIQHLVKRLKPGGFLVLGAGESLNNPHPELEQISYPNALAFRRSELVS